MRPGTWKDITGQVFGLLTVLEVAESKGPRAQWKCVCTCGKIKVAAGRYLRSGATRSCGRCLPRGAPGHGRPTHNGCGTREYSSWERAKSRCYNTHDPGYHRYGGRGIT